MFIMRGIIASLIRRHARMFRVAGLTHVAVANPTEVLRARAGPRDGIAAPPIFRYPDNRPFNRNHDCMADNRSTIRLGAILGFIAALLAESAVVVRYARTGIIDWRIAAAGLFIAALALSAWTRSGPRAAGSSPDA